jgi:cell division initiation protein
MRLSALDIKKKEFQQKMRGADPEEVQTFLDQVSQEVEALVQEKFELERKHDDAQKRLDHFLSLEQTLERTLVAAQQTAVRMEEQAKRESEIILKEAQLERDRATNDLRVERERATSELLRMRTEFDSTLARMRSLASSLTQFLENVDRDKNGQNGNQSTSVTNFASASVL